MKPWRWRQYVLPKHRFTFTGLYDVMSQGKELLTDTAAITSYPIQRNVWLRHIKDGRHHCHVMIRNLLDYIFFLQFYSHNIRNYTVSAIIICFGQDFGHHQVVQSLSTLPPLLDNVYTGRSRCSSRCRFLVADANKVYKLYKPLS